METSLGRGGAVEVEVGGEKVWLVPERAVVWPRERMLVVADLHWGKDEAFRAAGSLLPDGTLRSDLDRLRGLVEKWRVEKIVVVGDLVHAHHARDGRVHAAISRWRDAVKAEMLLVPGNHDKYLPALPGEWRIGRTDYLFRVGPFAFCHYPGESKGAAFTWTGHLHPQYVVRQNGERLALPCFWMSGGYGVLPAFSEFTGRGDLPRERPKSLYLICDGEVLKWE